MSIYDLHNGSHRPPPYFEWWYFQFASADGTTLNMVLHETDIFGLQQTPYLSLSVHLPMQEPSYLRRQLNQKISQRRETFLQVGQGMFSEDAEQCHFDITFADQGHFVGEIQKLAPPLILNNGILFRDGRSGRSSHWLVNIPHATFTATLQLKGKQYQLSGTAYQDHQWGSLLLHEWVRDWVWGHFSNLEIATLFFEIVTQTGHSLAGTVVMQDSGHSVATKLKTDYLANLQEQEMLEAHTAKEQVMVGQHQLQLNVMPTNLMRCRLNEVHEDHLISYLRWATASQLLPACPDVSLHGITEYIRVRPIYGSNSNTKHY